MQIYSESTGDNDYYTVNQTSFKICRKIQRRLNLAKLTYSSVNLNTIWRAVEIPNVNIRCY